jgi:uncharacterized SAM-binding protein YcdF (DUF218 family)
MPYPLVVLLLLPGLLLLWTKRRPWLARLLLTCGTLLLIGAGCQPVSKRFVRTLENDFSPLVDTAPLAGIEWVVVLGGGHTADPTLPPATRLNPAALARLVEAIRIQRQLPGSRLLVSGFGRPVSHARVLADAAVALGVDPSLIELDELSLDTEDEARLITKRLVGQRFVLVTSAVHLPRAAALFRAAGADFVPAPADFASGSGPATYSEWIFPRWSALGASERALHEYLGMAWSRLGGG